MSSQENNHRDQGQNHAASAQDLALPLREQCRKKAINTSKKNLSQCNSPINIVAI